MVNKSHEGGLNGYPVPPGFHILADGARVVDLARQAGVQEARVERDLFEAALGATGSRLDPTFPAQRRSFGRLQAATRGAVAREAVNGRARGARARQ